ncbi:hypothetical protein CDAR_614871 [Caerostris darwini]|uniref:Uncharacterized protein n=1 Tax=Caerostris darwini TaxID=1538125 RepID=A0AAV4RTK2_9ARAC|nr:hypothetical protein CDAR_614871 [Caerostris darwini]
MFLHNKLFPKSQFHATTGKHSSSISYNKKNLQREIAVVLIIPIRNQVVPVFSPRGQHESLSALTARFLLSKHDTASSSRGTAPFTAKRRNFSAVTPLPLAKDRGNRNTASTGFGTLVLVHAAVKSY